MKMPRFAWEKLRPLREDRGLSLEQVASAVGRDRGWLSRVERGEFVREPAHGLVDALAAFFGIPREDLLTPASDVAEPRARYMTAPVEEVMRLVGLEPAPGDTAPLIEEFQLSAGTGDRNLVPQDIDETLPKYQRPFRQHGLWRMYVTGRCMEPELSPGDLVFIDPDGVPEDGAIIAFTRDGHEAMVKRYRILYGRPYAVSENKKERFPIDDRIRIFGVVRAYLRRMV